MVKLLGSAVEWKARGAQTGRRAVLTKRGRKTAPMDSKSAAPLGVER
jgi:hypothetical protein